MLAFGMLVTGSAFAQETTKKEKKQRVERTEVRKVRKQKADPEERANRQAEMLSKKLALSETQQNQLQELNKKKAQELQALNDKYDRSDARNEARRAERKAIQDRWQADLKSILSEKQYATYEADRKEKRENLRKSGKERVKVQKRTREVQQKKSR